MKKKYGEAKNKRLKELKTYAMQTDVAILIILGKVDFNTRNISEIKLVISE